MPLAKTLALFQFALTSALAGISFDRSFAKVNGFDALSLEFDKGCKGSDKFGSTKCSWKWGQSLKLTYDAKVAAAVTGGNITIDAKVNKLIPFKADCPACGEQCTITIPIVKKKVTFEMPDCPLIPQGQHVHNTTKVNLPAKSPLPIKAGVVGTITVKDQTGKTRIKLNVDMSLAPGKNNMIEVRALDADADATAEVPPGKVELISLN